MPENVLQSAVRQLTLRAADIALSSATLRKVALTRADKALYDFYCVRRFEGLPLGVQEFRHTALMSLLHSIERAVVDGRISPRARRGILHSLVGNVIAKARKNVASFIARQGYEPPAFVVISPTQRCNLYCTGCYSSSSAKCTATLAYDTFCRVLEDKRDDWGSHFTVISGGEPFMYRSQGKTIFDVFERMQDNYFLVFSNGTLIDEQVAERLAQLANVTVAISVEGFEKETEARRGAGVFRKVERAMDLLRRAGVPFGISLTATRENADVLLSEEIVSHYMEEKGAIYAWLFHYMPIGRSFTVDRMVTPDQRQRMLDRQLDLMRNRGLFFIDFWNGGPMSGGCMSAGRSGGYFHIDWNGDVSPCVFMPYAVENVYEMYRAHRTLTSVLDRPVFKEIRAWQLKYAGRTGERRTGNMFAPCPIRDHHEVAHDILVRLGARPIHEDAALALGDAEYARRMVEYGQQISSRLDPIWEREVLAREGAVGAADRAPADRRAGSARQAPRDPAAAGGGTGPANDASEDAQRSAGA
jgi:MoaA/NifB/PqqE/SkfB family radical SAM enzyme